MYYVFKNIKIDIGKRINTILLGTIRLSFLSFALLLIPKTHLKFFLYSDWFVLFKYLIRMKFKTHCTKFPICDHYSSNNMMIIWNCCCSKCWIPALKCLEIHGIGLVVRIFELPRVLWCFFFFSFFFHEEMITWNNLICALVTI